ncbi:hypothetical protein V6N13_059765 [Hibiscus sabdariffa]|uniref:Uncharacterized protein n=1 Tax=Hibiscus sabdariffa TaxID=183260 RepID=A0ABR2GC30_9ROSI
MVPHTYLFKCASAYRFIQAVATGLEAAEILTAFTHSKNRDAVSVGVEFAAKWGCKGKRARKRVSTSESPPSDIGLNSVDPVQSCSDLVEAEEETNGSHRMLTDNDSDLQMIRERKILFNIARMSDKDVRGDKQQGQMTGNVELVKPVKIGKKAEPVKTSHACVAKYMSGGRRRQNLTEGWRGAPGKAKAIYLKSPFEAKLNSALGMISEAKNKTLAPLGKGK